MSTLERPMVNVPEGPDEANVYREMNDVEYAQWQEDQTAYEEAQAAEAARPHPLIEQLQAMTEQEQDALRKLLR